MLVNSCYLSLNSIHLMLRLDDLPNLLGILMSFSGLLSAMYLAWRTMVMGQRSSRLSLWYTVSLPPVIWGPCSACVLLRKCSSPEVKVCRFARTHTCTFERTFFNEVRNAGQDTDIKPTIMHTAISETNWMTCAGQKDPVDVLCGTGGSTFARISELTHGPFVFETRRAFN